ncbi:DoxX family protein [Candidatus Uhrbacteria bacterium]|nr:DoxX family protein [Candidatus Uhrbacteria bacterium]
MKEHFPTIWSLVTRTRPMWGMIPLRVMFGVIIILQGVDRLTGVREAGSILESLSHEWQLAVVLIFSIIEILAGVMAIPGILVRLVGFAIVIEMAVAIFFERIPLEFSGNLQAQLLMTAIAAMMVFSGAGRHSVDHWLACRHLVRYPNKKWELYCLAETPYTKWWE